MQRSFILMMLVILAAAPYRTGSAQVRYRDPVFNRVDVKSALAYGAAVNRYTQKLETLLLDLYTPNGDTKAERPAVVVVHGGGWVSGSRASNRFKAMCQDFAKRGYVAVSIDYRMAPNAQQRKLPESAWDSQEDTKAAVRYLRRHAKTYGVDPDRIAAIGSSAGAYAVVMAAYYAAEGTSGNPGHSSKIQAVTDLWGGTFDLKETETGEAPLLIAHGTLDPVVSYQNALDLEARLKAVKIPVELHPLTGRGHAPWGEYSKILVWSLDWYYRHLTLAQKNGLRARPGYASPGTLTLELTAPADMDALLVTSFLPAHIDLGPLGVVGLDPAHPILAVGARLPVTPGIAVKPVKFIVPPGLTGLTLYWQAVLTEAASPVPVTLTNAVATRF